MINALLAFTETIISSLENIIVTNTQKTESKTQLENTVEKAEQALEVFNKLLELKITNSVTDKIKVLSSENKTDNEVKIENLIEDFKQIKDKLTSQNEQIVNTEELEVLQNRLSSIFPEESKESTKSLENLFMKAEKELEELLGESLPVNKSEAKGSTKIPEDLGVMTEEELDKLSVEWLESCLKESTESHENLGVMTEEESDELSAESEIKDCYYKDSEAIASTLYELETLYSKYIQALFISAKDSQQKDLVKSSPNNIAETLDNCKDQKQVLDLPMALIDFKDQENKYSKTFSSEDFSIYKPILEGVGEKEYGDKFNLCFVGNDEKQKNLDAKTLIDNNLQKSIESAKISEKEASIAILISIKHGRFSNVPKNCKDKEAWLKPIKEDLRKALGVDEDENVDTIFKKMAVFSSKFGSLCKEDSLYTGNKNRVEYAISKNVNKENLTPLRLKRLPANFSRDLLKDDIEKWQEICDKIGLTPEKFAEKIKKPDEQVNSPQANRFIGDYPHVKQSGF